MSEQNLKIFEGIENEVKEKILSQCPEENFQKWTLILIEWEPSNGKWYIIRSGRVAIKIKGEQVSELSEGDIFWEIALLNIEIRIDTRM